MKVNPKDNKYIYTIVGKILKESEKKKDLHKFN